MYIIENFSFYFIETLNLMMNSIYMYFIVFISVIK